MHPILRTLSCTVLATAILAAADSAGIVVAAWDCGTIANGKIAPKSVGQPLEGDGTAVQLGARRFLHLAHGQNMTAALERGPLADAAPVAIEIEIQPEAIPDGYHGGLVEAGNYNASGVRILLQHDLRVSCEIFTAKEPVYLVSSEPIKLNAFTTIRYEHDGKRATLSFDGKPAGAVASAPAASWSGKLRLGVANGDNYNYNGAIGTVRVLAIPAAK